MLDVVLLNSLIKDQAASIALCKHNVKCYFCHAHQSIPESVWVVKFEWSIDTQSNVTDSSST